MNTQGTLTQVQTPCGTNVMYGNGQNYASPQLQNIQTPNQGSPCYTPVYNTPPSYINLTGPDQFSQLMNRFDVIEKKLTQLDSIQNTVRTFSGRLDKLDTRVAKVEQTLNDVEKSREMDSSNIEDIQKKQNNIDAMLNNAKKLESEQKMLNKKVQKELIDIKSRSMRDNLLFFGIPEEQDERDIECVGKVLNMIEHECRIENASTIIKLHRAHRIGKYNAQKTRPIVAKFAFYPERERVRYCAKDLVYPKGISQQFPQEILEIRKRLWPILKKARDEKKEAFFVADRLYINGHLYREPAKPEVNPER